MRYEMTPKDLIVNFTPTGMVPTKADTPYIPITPKEITLSIKELLQEQLLTIVHLHARNEAGKPTNDLNTWKEIIYNIRNLDQSLIICVSTSGRTNNTFKNRSAPLTLKNDYKPDMASLTLSSLNFISQASENSPMMIQDLATMMLDKGIVPELECFDAGMINYSKYLIRKGLIKPPYYMNIILGNIAGAQPQHAQQLIYDIPPDCTWAFGGIGRYQLQSHLLALALGGNIRVGLEDNLNKLDGSLATNYDLVSRTTQIASLANRSVMAPSAFRTQLNLNTTGREFGRSSS